MLAFIASFRNQLMFNAISIVVIMDSVERGIRISDSHIRYYTLLNAIFCLRSLDSVVTHRVMITLIGLQPCYRSS